MTGTETLYFVLITCTGVMVQSVVGFGGALLSIPLFVLFIDPRQAVPTYNLTMLLVELMLLIDTWRNVVWIRVFKLLAGAFIGVPIGAYALAILPANLMVAIISILTMLFVTLLMFKTQAQIPETIATQMGVGFCSGLLGGAISISGPPIVIFGLAREWPKDVFRSTLLAFFFFLSILALVWFGRFGLFSRQSVSMSLAAFVPVMLVGHVGIHIKRRISETVFRNVVMAIIILVSLLGLSQVVLGR